MIIYTIEDAISLFGSLVPVGFLLGFVPILFGLAVNGIMKIFSKS